MYICIPGLYVHCKKKKLSHLKTVYLLSIIFILYINKYNVTYFSQIYTCVCLYLYIHNKYTQYTHICKYNIYFRFD